MCSNIGLTRRPAYWQDFGSYALSALLASRAFSADAAKVSNNEGLFFSLFIKFYGFQRCIIHEKIF